MRVKPKHLILAVTVTVCIQLLPASLLAAKLTDEERTILDKVWTADYFTDVKDQRQYYAREKYGGPWDFEDGTRERITHLSPGIENARVENGKLKFTTSKEKVLIAWGAYFRTGEVKTQEQIDLPNEGGWANVDIRVKQSKDHSKWFVCTHTNGAHGLASYHLPRGQRELKGTDWQSLKADIKIPGDSLGIEIEGPVGNEIEIDSVAVYSALYLGYYRKTFDLPPDKVWKTVLNVSRPGMAAQVYVNGQMVYQMSPIADGNWNPWGRTAYNPIPWEITSYLKPGKNVIAVYGERYGYPPAFLIQGTIACVSGKRVFLKTDKTWKWNDKEENGWTRPEFDDSHWKKIERTRKPAFVYMAGERPYYDGYLRVVNPYQKKLHYKDSQEIKFRIEVPSVFAARQLSLTYQIDRLTSPAQEGVAKGTVAKGAVKGGVLAYEVSLGKLPQGIYRATFDLGGTEEDGLLPRSEEFAVVGPIAQKLVAGDSYEEGMELELEDTIDCTNPNDPHPFYDSDGKLGSKILQVGKLKYRETQPYGCYFSYAIKFRQVGSPYLIAVDYPDDRERLINFSLQTLRDNYISYIKAETLLSWDVTTPGYICGGGGRFPLSGEMKTAKFFHWSRTPEAAINIENNPYAFDSCAAAARIRIYRVKNIPALKIPNPGGRLFGVGTEWGDIIGATFWTKSAHARTRFPNSHAEWYDTIENFIKYLRFSGQNLVNLGAWMYTGGRYYQDRMVDDSSMEEDFRHLMLEMFEENGISMTVGLEYCYSAGFPAAYYASDEQVAEEGRDTVWSMSREGKQNRQLVMGGPNGTVNPFHPQVQKEIIAVADELLNKFKTYQAFKGIAFHIFPGIYAPSIGMDSWRSGNLPIDWGYDDVSIAAFEKDTKARIPVDPKDPERFGKRYDWLMANAKEKWVSWRCQKIFELSKEIFRHVKAARKDLILVNNLAIYEYYSKQWVKTGMSATQYLREMGYDPRLYQGTKDLYFSRYQFQLISHTAKAEDQHFNWAWAISPEVTALFDREESRGYCIQMPFNEHGGPSLETNPQEWPWKLGNFGAHNIAWPAPGHEHFKEAYTRSFIESDPDLVTFCMFDSNIPVGHEQEMREFARVFCSLPEEKFTRLEGDNFDPNIVVKELRKGNGYYFCVVNPGWWQVTTKVSVKGISARETVIDLVTGKKVPLTAGQMEVRLGPYDIRAFRISSREARVAKVQASPQSKQARAFFSQRVGQLRKMLTSPSAKALLDDDELAESEQRLEETEGFAQAGDYVEANESISDWRLNQIASTKLAKANGVTPWYVIGPFPNDREGKGFFTSFPVEKEVLARGDVDQQKQYQGAASQVKWRKATSIERGGHGFVDFNEIFYPNEWVCAYAFKRLSSPKKQEVTLSLGSDDGLKVWFNGKEVISNYIARAARPGEDQVKVVMEKGINTILIKVEEQIGGWGFYLEILGEDGQPLNLD